MLKEEKVSSQISLVNSAWLLIYLSVVLFAWYLIVLICNGYINLNSNFDFSVAKDIGVFVGNFIAPFLTFAGTLLLIANFREVEKNTKEINDNNRIDKTIELIQWYFTEFQEERKKLKDLTGISPDWMIYLYQRIPYLPDMKTIKSFISENSSESRAFLSDTQNHSKTLITYLHKLHYFSISITKSTSIDSELAKDLLQVQFIEETKFMLIYIRYYQIEQESFCNHVIDLYQSWGGECGNNGEIIVSRIQS
jgi:hypothetical protein